MRSEQPVALLPYKPLWLDIFIEFVNGQIVGDVVQQQVVDMQTDENKSISNLFHLLYKSTDDHVVVQPTVPICIFINLCTFDVVLSYYRRQWIQQSYYRTN